jgi:hypothetical protein
LEALNDPAEGDPRVSKTYSNTPPDNSRSRHRAVPRCIPSRISVQNLPKPSPPNSVDRERL